MTRNHFANLGVGVGLRIPHYEHIFKHKPQVDFFEIISENFMVEGGPPLKNLDKILEEYRVVQHGVSMNIASSEALDFNYLKKLKKLTKITKTPWVSDHLCWTSSHGHNFHDLLPVPYTEENALYIADKARQVQDFLEMPFALENLSTYISFKDNHLTEWEFYSMVVEEAGCYMLLDLNNIYVSSVNHHFHADDYLNNIPWHRVAQMHLAGPSLLEDGTMLDTHSTPVLPEVWALYEKAINETRGISTLIEWDEDIPDFVNLMEEVHKAKEFQFKFKEVLPPSKLNTHQEQFGKCISLPLILEEDSYSTQSQLFEKELIKNIQKTAEKTSSERVETYNEQYWFRLIDVMQSEYPFLCELLGFKRFNRLIVQYINKYPSRYFSLTKLSDRFVEFIHNTPEWDNGMNLQVAQLEYIFICLFDQAETVYDFNSLKLVEEKNSIGIDPSLHLYIEDFNITENYKLYKTSGILSDNLHLLPTSRKYWLINRFNGQYNIVNLSFTQYTILKLLKEGNPLEQVFDIISERLKSEEIQNVERNLETWFSEWTLMGIFTQT